jgi:hypothetical protein
MQFNHSDEVLYELSRFWAICDTEDHKYQPATQPMVEPRNMFPYRQYQRTYKQGLCERECFRKFPKIVFYINVNEVVQKVRFAKFTAN